MVLPQIFLYACLAMVAGVGLASAIEVSKFLLWMIAAIAVFLFVAGLAARKHKITVAGILLISFILGFWRFEIVWHHNQNNQLTKAIGTTVRISGEVANDPVFDLASQQLVVSPEGMDGKILVITNRYPEYQYGDRIEFESVIAAPQNADNFDYKNYLAKDGIYSTALLPKVKLLSSGNGNPVYSGLLWVKHKLAAGINKSLPAPQNSLLTAILFGDQSGLEGCTAKETKVDPNCAKLKEKLNIAGLRHLAAVSGTHVTIMAGILLPLFLALGFWRRQAFWSTLAFIWGFILMIGLPASAVRAGIMGSLMILAQIIGRPADISRAVSLAAAFMVWQNPMVLRFDIGFQLSFLAVLGMAYFAKPIEAGLGFVFKQGREALAITLAAQIFTLPLLIYNFGYVSLYAPLANLLVEPVVPFITIYGFILAIVGAISAVAGWFLFFPMWLALTYLLRVTEFFSGLPGAKLDYHIDFIWLAASYVVLAIIAWRLKENEKLDFLK
jgi:competence protein ComEC